MSDAVISAMITGTIALIGTIIGLLMPYLNERIFDKYIPLDDKTSLVQVCTMILVFSISNLTFTIVKNLAIFRISNSSQIRIQSAVFDRLFARGVRNNHIAV